MAQGSTPIRASVDGTFIWTASHDQRQCSLSTVSFAGVIVAGPEPRSSWSAHSEARTNDLDGGENVGDQLDLPAGGAKTVRWPSQNVTGFPGSLRRHSVPNIRLEVAHPRPHLRADDPVLAPPQRPNDASSSRPDHGRSFVCKGTELLCPDQPRCSAAEGLGRVSGMIKRSEPN